MATNAEVYEKVTQVIIDCMEKGVAPWRQPWSDAGVVPTSVATGKAYRGINSWILQAVAMWKGYDQPFWMTFKQAKALGGSVKKGEKATEVILWKPMEKVDEKTGEKSRFMLVRTFYVFNIAQTEGVTLPAKFNVKREKVEPLEAMQTLIDGYVDGPTLRWGSTTGAHYTPATDVLAMPAKDTFTSATGMFNTLAHEFTHSTGHESRLGREIENRFGCEKYAQEELVAEIGSSILADALGVDPEFEQSAAYCQSWLKVLKDDRSILVRAAQQAQKAADRILSHVPAEQAEPVAEEVAA